MPKKPAGFARSSRRAAQKSQPRNTAKAPSKGSWRDPDDAPEITDAMLPEFAVMEGDRVVRRGRPPLGAQPKTAITLRLDVDIVAAYRDTGNGWQSRINADLRKARRLGKLAS